MRSSSEIAAEINALKAQIASGMPYGNSEAHNAAVFDHVYSGDRSGVDAFQRAIEQAIQNKMQRELTSYENEKNRQNALKIAEMGKAEAVAERKQKAEELAALKLAQARPEYMKLQKQMLDAVDAGNMEEAAIIKRQMDAIEFDHGAKFGEDAQGLINAREQARIARENKAKTDAEKRLRVANFLADLPTTFKDDNEKKLAYADINANTDMTPEQKAKEIERIRNIESGKTKVKKAAQGGAASYTGEKVKSGLEERDKGIALARKAKQKKDSGRLLLKTEQDALDKWGKEL